MADLDPTAQALQDRQQGDTREYPILWWTKWFKQTIEEGKVVDYCGLPYTCRFTLDRSKYDEAKVVVIHASSFDPKDVPSIEDVQSGRKAWVLNTLEAPWDWQIKSKWTEIFTHLWSYSFGTADFVQSYFFAGRGPGSFIENILAKPMYTIQEKNQFRQSLAPIAWIVSSCTSENGRHFYVKQLLKYIDVDIYGHCMRNKDWPTHPDGQQFTDREVVGRYKFYLSIENTNCNDYVTEKIERPYAVGVVPILDGPRDYSRFIPTNHSTIRLDEFATPEQLAIRIHQLDHDDEAYLTYLDHKALAPNTPIDSVLNPKLLETFDLAPGVWGPDDYGARCGVCKLAHDMAEGLYKYDPSKTIGYDKTCAFRKWAFISWGFEFYWWIGALVILGIVAGGAVILACSKSRRVRQCLYITTSKVTPAWLKSKKTLNKNIKMYEYKTLATD
ncbi:Alpha 1,3 fucosyltransferase [Mortierella alpina]|nr:Alpha 1,3 fucosyltransferase [Mortierella alpina]